MGAKNPSYVNLSKFNIGGITSYIEIYRGMNDYSIKMVSFCTLNLEKWLKIRLFRTSFLIPTRRGLNNSVYAILLFVSLSVLILRCICIILFKNALVIILLSRLITRIISPWIIWKWYANIIAYNLSYCNSKL